MNNRFSYLANWDLHPPAERAIDPNSKTLPSFRPIFTDKMREEMRQALALTPPEPSDEA